MSEDKRLNEVIRVKKQPSNFVLLDKTFLEDDRLSFKAKGILAYLLSKPDDWKVIVGNLVNYSADGKASVYAGLKELKEYGYYEKIPVRNEQGTRIVRWESVVYEVPKSLFTDFQEVEDKDITEQEDTGVRSEEETVEDGTLSLLPGFQEIENQDIENQFLENRERNNNYNTKNYNTKNNITSCLSCQTGGDRQPDPETVVSLLRENIGYEDFRVAHAGDIALVDEFVNIMADAVLSKGKTVRINGEEKPRELVRSALMKLNYFHLEHVLHRFKSHDRRIRKKRQYILSMLYHSSMELESGLVNEVHVDFGC